MSLLYQADDDFSKSICEPSFDFVRWMEGNIHKLSMEQIDILNHCSKITGFSLYSQVLEMDNKGNGYMKIVFTFGFPNEASGQITIEF